MFDPKLVTQMLVPSNATRSGLVPTVIVADTTLVAGSILDTFSENGSMTVRSCTGQGAFKDYGDRAASFAARGEIS